MEIILDESIIVTKILTELKYNKRLIYNWKTLFDLSEIEEKNLRKFLENEVRTVKKLVESDGVELGKIGALPVYKKVSNDDSSNEQSQFNIVTFSSGQKIKGNIEYNYFIELKLQEFILSAIWIETVGKILDSSLSYNVYANRVSDSKNTFFKPYFKSYTNFRDSNFKKMREWTDNEETGVYVQTDLSRCYYHFNIRELKEDVDNILANALLNNYENSVDKDYLKNINNYIFEIIDRYNELEDIIKFKEDTIEDKLEIDNTEVLPIGFLPSNILSNIYLTKLDDLIEAEFFPDNYGRYVDDISFLIRKRINTENINKDINPIVEKIGNIAKKLKERRINLNPSKTIFLVIDKQNDTNYLNKFEKETQLLTSDSYRLIDPFDYDTEFDNAYKLTKSITKMPDLFTIARDKKYISRTISTIFNYIYWELDSNYNDEGVKLAKKFIDYIYSFIDDEFFLDLFDYWYQLVDLEILSKSDNKDVNQFKNLLFFQRLALIDNQETKLKEFINHYKESIYLFFNSDEDSLLSQIQANFKLPRYKLSNLFAEKYLLNHEQQLRSLIDFSNHSESEFVNIIKNNFSNKGGNDIYKGGASSYGKKALDLNPKSMIRVGQSNFFEYDLRKNDFLSNGKAKTNISDIIKTLNEADREKVDILIYPEQGIPIQDLLPIVKYAVKTKTLILGGIDFIYLSNKVFNFSFIVRPFITEKSGKQYNDAEIILLPKIYPSPEEYETFHNTSLISKQNWEIYLPIFKDWRDKHTIEFRGYKHAVLNCYEATSVDLKYEMSKQEPEIIHLITNNKDTEYYFQLSESMSRDLMSATTITNYSRYGGVQVFVPYKEKYQRHLSMHKGSKNIHVDVCEVNLEQIRNKRVNNLDKIMKQNPPKYYYRNVGKD